MNLLTLKESRSVIKLIAAAGRKLDERIHQVACSGLNHYLEHGDLTALTELCHVMPKSSRGNALKQWCTKNANLKWSTKAYAGEGGWVKDTKVLDFCNLDQAIESPFYEKPDTEASVWNPDTAMLRFVQKLKKEQPNTDPRDVLENVLQEAV